MHALSPAGSTSHTASMVSPTGFSTIISYCPEWALELNCRMVRLACWVKPPSTVIMIPFWGRSRVPLCLHSTPLIPTPWNWAVRVMDSAGAGYTALSEELTSAGTAQDREDSTVNTKVINIVGKTEPQVKMRWWQITNKNCTIALFPPGLHLLSLYGASYSNQFHMLIHEGLRVTHQTRHGFLHSTWGL